MPSGNPGHAGAIRAARISIALASIVVAAPVGAQCALQWSATPPPAVSGPSFATTAWDPDGNGPAAVRLVAAYHIATPQPYGSSRIAALDTATLGWTTLSASEPGPVFCMLPLPNGDLVVGGNFSFSSGAIDLARFDGTSWSQFAAPVVGQVLALARLPNGDIVAGGDFTHVMPSWVPARALARWNGTAWQQMFAPGQSPTVGALLALPDGSLVVGGWFDNPQTGVLLWNNGWAHMGAGLNLNVHCLARLPDGSIFAGGPFTGSGSQSLQYMARFDGTAWQPFGGGANGYVSTATVLPTGDLLVGGSFSSIGGVAAQGIARWDGTTWHAVGGLGQTVRSLAVAPDGRVVAGGFFTPAGAVCCVAHGVSTCAAAATSVPTACAGPAGPMALAAETLPWLGATFASRATGFVPTSFAIAVLGFAPANVPLLAAHPAALPGCDLLASADVLSASVPAAGVATWSIALPNAPSLIGVHLFHQFAQLELAGSGAIVSLSSSNALDLTLGGY